MPKYGELDKALDGQREIPTVEDFIAELPAMLRLSGSLSRALNYWTGGERGQTLCARIAIRFGSDCLFCRLVGRVLNDQFHCLDEKVGWLRKK